jgi:putative transposase
VSEKYAFIAAQYVDHAGTAAKAPTIAQMTDWLGVSKSGYYEWCARPVSDAAARRDELKVKIAALFNEFGGVYGYRRVHAELVRAGEQVGPELVRKLMRELNLVPLQPKPYKRTTIPGEPEQAVATWWTATSARIGPGSSWSATSPTSPPGRAGCIRLP